MLLSIGGSDLAECHDSSGVGLMTCRRRHDCTLRVSSTEGNMRRGATLPELVVVLGTIGLVTAIATTRFGALRDRMSVRAAAEEAFATFALARRWSLSRATRTAVAIDTTTASLLVRTFADTIAHRKLGASHGVSMSATRDSMAYAPNGLGYGASNLSLVLRRGAAAETVFVSRLGRVRR
jgi:Tfp pilus assembly protein FimT